MEWDNRNRDGWDRSGPPDLMDLVSKDKQRQNRATGPQF